MSLAQLSPTPPPQRRLGPGDRFPDFGLPDHVGMVRSYYQRAHGSGTAVFLDSDEALRASLRDLEGAYKDARLDRLVVDTVAENADGAPWILADASGRFRQGVREMSGTAGVAGPVAFLLDRNQRVLAVASEGSLAEWALGRWKEQPPAKPAAQIAQGAPALIVPNVLSPADCQGLIKRWHEMGHREGTITSVVDGKVADRVYEDIKKRRDHVLSDPEVRKPLMATVARRLGPEVHKAFCYGSFIFDRVLIACYDAERGDHFKPHRDNSTPTTKGRRFALTLNLNSDEYDGGELVFPEYGDDRYKPPAGAAVVFSCSLLHEALPVTRGTRYALLSFLLDMPNAPAR
jgi:predicted 2-oxoglutarate/Fe(II)-dependent dioxygenase YbiX